MKKVLIAVAIATSASAVMADGWKFAPLFTDPSFKLQPAVALTVGAIDPKVDNMSVMSAVGVDFNFNCGILQDPQNRMRTHLNISQGSKDDAKVLAVELSPRYTRPLGDGMSVGYGPSVAAYKFKDDKTGFEMNRLGLGVAVGANYRQGAFYAGADLRYHATNEKNNADFDNVSAGVKVGMNF